MTLKDLKKINGKLKEAQKVVSYVLANQGQIECPSCSRILPRHRYYEYATNECKECKIKRSKARTERLKEANG